MLISKFVARFERLVVHREQLGNGAPLRRVPRHDQWKVVDPAVVGAEEEASARVSRIDRRCPHRVSRQLDAGRAPVRELDSAVRAGVLEEVKGRCRNLTDPATVAMVAVALVLGGNSGCGVDMVLASLALANDHEVSPSASVPVDGGCRPLRPRLCVEVHPHHVDGQSRLPVRPCTARKRKGHDGLVGVVPQPNDRFNDAVAVEIGRREHESRQALVVLVALGRPRYGPPPSSPVHNGSPVREGIHELVREDVVAGGDELRFPVTVPVEDVNRRRGIAGCVEIADDACVTEYQRRSVPKIAALVRARVSAHLTPPHSQVCIA